MTIINWNDICIFKQERARQTWGRIVSGCWCIHASEFVVTRQTTMATRMQLDRFNTMFECYKECCNSLAEMDHVSDIVERWIDLKLKKRFSQLQMAASLVSDISKPDTESVHQVWKKEEKQMKENWSKNNKQNAVVPSRGGKGNAGVAIDK